MRSPMLVALKGLWDKNASIVTILLCLALGTYSISQAMGKAQEATAIGTQIEFRKTIVAAGERKLAEACAVFPDSGIGKRLATWEEMPLFLDAMLSAAQMAGGIDFASLESVGGAEPKTLLSLESARIVETSMKIETNGTYKKTMGFLKSMERIPYAAQVDSLLMEGGAIENGARALSLTLTLKVFVYEMVNNR